MNYFAVKSSLTRKKKKNQDLPDKNPWSKDRNVATETNKHMEIVQNLQSIITPSVTTIFRNTESYCNLVMLSL